VITGAAPKPSGGNGKWVPRRPMRFLGLSGCLSHHPENGESGCDRQSPKGKYSVTAAVKWCNLPLHQWHFFSLAFLLVFILGPPVMFLRHNHTAPASCGI
jgi:hypothetical protein